MDLTRLGDTGMTATIMGLGSGGHSRLGTSREGTAGEAERVVLRALELGVNLIDSAESYSDTESIIGGALKISGRPRSDVILSTKIRAVKEQGFVDERRFIETFERSCRRLGTDYIDIYHLHGVKPEEYEESVERYLPLLQRLKREGRIRAIGITEMFGGDHDHAALSKAVETDLFDVFMVGFNILNQSARPVLAKAAEKGIGILTMFAIRRALTSYEALAPVVRGMIERGELDAGEIGPEPLAFLVEEGHAGTLAEAGYRFCRHEPGTGCILSGTGSIAHLEENIRSLSMPPLPREVQERLGYLFRRPSTESGN